MIVGKKYNKISSVTYEIHAFSAFSRMIGQTLDKEKHNTIPLWKYVDSVA